MSTKISPQWKTRSMKAVIGGSSVSHVLRQKMFFTLSRAVQCCHFSCGTSTKCIFCLASCRYVPYPWLCFFLPLATVLWVEMTLARPIKNWHWLARCLDH